MRHVRHVNALRMTRRFRSERPPKHPPSIYTLSTTSVRKPSNTFRAYELGVCLGDARGEAAERAVISASDANDENSLIFYAPA